MDPIVEKPKRSKKKLFIGIGAILALLLIGGGGYGYWWWMKTEPEREFKVVLANMLDIKYLRRQVTFTSVDLKQKLYINAGTDFSSNDKPKTALNYLSETSAAPLGPAKSATQSTLKVDQVMVDDEAVYENVIYSQASSSQLGRELNQWYRISEVPYDPQGSTAIISGVINTPLSTIIAGNFTKDQREHVMQSIRSGNIYTLDSRRKDTTNGKEFIVYKMSINNNNLEDLYKGLDGVLTKTQITKSLDTVRTYSNFEVWVEEASQRVSRILASVSGPEPFVGTLGVQYEYPDSLDIKIPYPAKELSN